ncbi:MAG: hypothetical protein IJ187_00400 [Neisseriaceae bacterium]|nr:hypothetical protein [Neisseriaceae bacterium]MBQ9725206.1 hypothetical protein [Neisseriaceae bacterium]
MSEQTIPQTQPENRQSAVGDSSSYVSPVPPLANESDSGIGGIITAFIAIIALLVSGYNYWQMRNQAVNETANVAVVDTDLIVSAYFAKNSNINNVEVLNDLQKINAIIDEQAANGVLVVKGSAVLGLPEQQNITLTVANQLGLSDSDLSRAVSLKQQQQTQQERQQSEVSQPTNTQTDDLGNLGLGSALD